MNDPPRVDRASVLTPPGRGAVAVVAAQGQAAMQAVDAHFRAAHGKPIAEQPIGRVAFGHWHDDDGRAEEVLVSRLGDGRLEIHCHGGVAASTRILHALAAAGCRVESWQGWLRQEGGDSIEAETDVALAAATTRRAAAILLGQRQGALRSSIERAQHELKDGQIDVARRRLDALLQSAALGLHLTEPWQVAIAGRPNVGKSSLINALVGYQRAIVFDQPGTTRDVLAAETAIDGWPVRLTDAAGLRPAADPLEAAGVLLARETLAGSDAVIWVLDATALTPAEAADPVVVARRQLTVEAPALADSIDPLVVVNKIDLLSEGSRALTSTPALLPTSAVTGEGLDALLAAISRRLASHLPAPDQPVIFARRHAELLAATLAALDGSVAAAAAQLDRLLRGE